MSGVNLPVEDVRMLALCARAICDMLSYDPVLVKPSKPSPEELGALLARVERALFGEAMTRRFSEMGPGGKVVNALAQRRIVAVSLSDSRDHLAGAAADQVSLHLDDGVSVEFTASSDLGVVAALGTWERPTAVCVCRSYFRRTGEHASDCPLAGAAT